jgi:hypothetical protein
MGVLSVRRDRPSRYPVSDYNEADEGQGTGRALGGSDRSPGRRLEPFGYFARRQVFLVHLP